MRVHAQAQAQDTTKLRAAAEKRELVQSARLCIRQHYLDQSVTATIFKALHLILTVGGERDAALFRARDRTVLQLDAPAEWQGE
eukprot:jgi/Chlat1/8584/Chrsp85S07985